MALFYDSAVARARRAANKNPWGESQGTLQSRANVDNNDFPKLVITRETVRNNIVEGCRVEVFPQTVNEFHECRPLGQGTVHCIRDSDAAGLPAMVVVKLDWKLTGDTNATITAPKKCLHRVHDDDSPERPMQTQVSLINNGINEMKKMSATSSSGTNPILTSKIASEQHVSPSSGGSTTAPHANNKSRILPSARSGLASTTILDEDDGDDGDDWVTPGNIGTHIGHGGFGKSYDTVSLDYMSRLQFFFFFFFLHFSGPFRLGCGCTSLTGHVAL